MTDRTPDWLVERLHAGDLPAAEAEAVRRRLEAEGGLSRLDALRQDDAAFRITHPAVPAVEEIRRRAGGARRTSQPWRRWRLVAVPALAAVAAVAVAVLLPRLPADDTRVKGDASDAHLQVYLQSQPDPLRSGATAAAGDLLQLAYVSAGAPYGVILSVDGRGAVTLHWPERGGPAARLQGGGAVPLAHAYQLDDAPRFERFFLVTGQRPFDSSVVVDAARRLAASADAETAPLPLPGGLAQKAIVLKKR